MSLDHFLSGVFATTAAVRDGQVGLDLGQAFGPAVHDLANLSITDPVAQADVHGIRPEIDLMRSKYKCE